MTPHVRRRSMQHETDAGSGTVLVFTVIALLLAALGGVMALGSTLVARHRAASAADLAALAGADRALEGMATACAVAASIAAEHDAELTACDVDGDVVDVITAVPLPGGLHSLGPATARARAGPSDDTAPAGMPAAPSHP